MPDHNANIGSVSMTEKTVPTGRGPHVYRHYRLKAGLAALVAGLVVALDAADEVVPFGADQAIAQDGDGALTSFAFRLGNAQTPGTISVTDGTETFTDDGFGGLAGDAGGSGQVNYQTGEVSVTFNAAPADAASNVVCTYQPALRGVLVREAKTDAAGAEVLVLGQVDRKELLVGDDAPTAAQLALLDRNNIWPVG